MSANASQANTENECDRHRLCQWYKHHINKEQTAHGSWIGSTQLYVFQAAASSLLTSLVSLSSLMVSCGSAASPSLLMPICASRDHHTSSSLSRHQPQLAVDVKQLRADSSCAVPCMLLSVSICRTICHHEVHIANITLSPAFVSAAALDWPCC